jgi:hypothetical protein
MALKLVDQRRWYLLTCSTLKTERAAGRSDVSWESPWESLTEAPSTSSLVARSRLREQDRGQGIQLEDGQESLDAWRKCGRVAQDREEEAAVRGCISDGYSVGSGKMWS